MKNLNNVKIIAVDHGYGNIKTANTVFPAGITEYESEPIFAGNILEYGGKFYRIGEEHKEFIPDKSSDDDYYLLTLAAVAKELNTFGIKEADVHLAAGLPLTWVRKQREEFRSYLMQNKTAEFRFNGKDYKIRFVGCRIYPQGYPAVISKISDFDGTNLLVDIGNGTMNILYISNRKPIESRCWTEKAGVNQCMIAAKNAVLDNFGIKIDDSVIETVIRKRTADIAKPYLDCILRTVNQYVNNIFAILRKYEYNPDLVRLYVIGGGGCLIKNFGNYDKERVTIIDDICETSKGYEYIAYSTLRRKEHQ
ncbi:MAG: ParM/StbA family protein [Oscillospiraceae bacterium]|nr:ParM/StbA family protein [Oscillospiraceae bacterium]